MRRLSLAYILLALAPVGAGGVPKDKQLTNTIGIKLVRIEPGEFLMGEGSAPPKTKAEWTGREWDEAPAHAVKISKPYFLGTTEVTNAQFEQFDPDHKKLRGLAGASVADDEP